MSLDTFFRRVPNEIIKEVLKCTCKTFVMLLQSFPRVIDKTHSGKGTSHWNGKAEQVQERRRRRWRRFRADILFEFLNDLRNCYLTSLSAVPCSHIASLPRRTTFTARATCGWVGVQCNLDHFAQFLGEKSKQSLFVARH